MALDPNLAAAWHSSGWASIYLGDPEAAIERIEHAMRLSSLDPLLFGMLNQHFWHRQGCHSCADTSLWKPFSERILAKPLA